MHFVVMVLIGLVAGVLAKLMMPGRDPGGVLATILLGIAGSLLAGFLGRAVGWYRTESSGPGILASAIGAFILLALYRVATKRGIGRHNLRL